MEPTITRMYPSGPYRLFSEERFSGAVPYADSVRRGYAGKYVCELCQSSVRDVIITAGQWICRNCVRCQQQRRDTRATALKKTRDGMKQKRRTPHNVQPRR
jgi:hypothetical protein